MRAAIHPLAVTVVAFVILGSVLEGIPAIVLFGPLLFPIARQVGVHDVHYDKQRFVVSVVAYDSLPGHHVIEEIFSFNNLSAVSVLRLPDCLTRVRNNAVSGGASYEAEKLAFCLFRAAQSGQHKASASRCP